jgi:hypothetical protein
MNTPIDYTPSYVQDMSKGRLAQDFILAVICLGVIAAFFVSLF